MSVNIFHENFPRPETLEEAVELIIAHVFTIPEWKKFVESHKDEESSSFLVEVHQTLGRQMRNEWGLWNQRASDKLYYDMYRRGFRHPDDISAVIIQTAFCEYHGGSFDVEGAAEYYKGWWEAEWEKTWNNITDAAAYVVERYEGIGLFDEPKKKRRY